MKPRVLSISMFLLTAAVPAWAGTSYTWNNSAGGSWNTAANWSPNGVPGAEAGDSATIALAGSYSITLTTSPANPISAVSLGGASGSQTLNVSATTFAVSGAVTGTASGTLSVTAGTTTLSGSLASVNMTISGGTVNETGTGLTPGTLSISSGVLEGTGTVAVSGQFTWMGGRIGSGSGSTPVVSFDGGTFTGTLFLDGGTLSNSGNLAWNGDVLDGNGSVINNTGAITITSTTSSSYGTQNEYSGAGQTFNNMGAGTVLVQGAATSVAMFIDIFNNSSTAANAVNVTAGTLSLGGGGTETTPFAVSTGATLTLSGGTFNSTATSISGGGNLNVSGATASFASGLDLTGTWSFSGGTATLTGSAANASTMTISGGKVDVTGTGLTPGALNMSSGTLEGTSTVAVSGQFTSTGGFIGGTLGTSIVVSFDGGTFTGTLFLDGATLSNSGNLAWNGMVLDGNGSVINNTGAITITSATSSSYGTQNEYSGTQTFNNMGAGTVLVQGAATGTASFIDIFNNSSTAANAVNVTAGTLSLGGGGTETTPFAVSTGATLTLSGGTFNSTATSISGGGNLIVSGATASFASGLGLTGTWTFSSGTANLTGSAANASTMTISGGKVDVTGTGLTPGALNMSSGTLEGTSTVAVSGQFTSTGGFIGGTLGTSIVVSFDGGTFTGTLFLDGATLSNSGNLAWNGMVLDGNGSVINNTGAITITSATSSSYGTQNEYSGTQTFNNMGAGTVLVQGAATGTASFIDIFNNSSTAANAVNVTAGTLSLGGGGTETTPFAVSTGATLTLSGGTFNSTATSISGGGNLIVSGATASFASGLGLTGTWTFSSGTANLTGSAANASTMTISGGIVNETGTGLAPGTLSMSAGTLEGTSTVTVQNAGQFTWTGGRIGTGSGTAMAVSFNGGTFTGPSLLLDGATLSNSGALAWNGAVLDGNGSVINNTGAITITSTASSGYGTENEYGAPQTFNNMGTGTLTLTGAATGAVSFVDTFNNSSTAANAVNIAAGTLTLGSGGGTETGAFTTAATTCTLDLGSGVLNFNSGSSISGPGVLTSSATVTFSGPPTVITIATVDLTGGTFAVDTTSPLILALLSMSAGTLEGTSTVTVQNAGQFTWTGGRIGTGSGTAMAVSFNGGTFTGPSLLLDGATLSNSGALAWNGAVLDGNGSVINNTGAITITSTASSGYGTENEYGAPQTFNNMGTVTATGAVGGTATIIDTVNNTGILSAQDGDLKLSGGHSLTGGALNSGLTSASTYGTNTLAGAAPLTGTLSANLINGYVPTIGTTFQVLDYTSFSGSFTNTNLPPVAVWQTTYNAANVTIKVLKLVPTITWPTPANIVYDTALTSAQLDATAASPGGGISLTGPGTFTYSLLPSGIPVSAGTILNASNQTLAVVFTPSTGDQASFSSATTTVKIDVTPLPAVLTGTRAYDGTTNAASTILTVANFVGSDTVTVVSGSGGLAGSTVGLEAITSFGTLALGGAQAANYTLTGASGSVKVIPTTPTITTAPTATSITYSQALGASTLSGGVASTSGTFAFTTPSITPGAGTASQSVTFTPTDTTDYNTITTAVSVTVNKATPTITTAPTANAITYGQALSASTLSGGAASVPGNFAFTTPTTTPSAGTAPQSVTFIPTDATDYNTVAIAVSVTVNKATPTITTVPTASAITYGQALSASTLSGGVASTPGTFAFTTPSITPGAGTASQSVTFTPTDATDYNTVTTTVSVTVNKTTPTITTAPTASAITYGQALSASTLSGGVASVAGTFAFTTAATAPGAGTAPQSVTFTPTDTSDYNTVTTTVSVTVNKATPTITTVPTASAITYGQALSASTLSGGVASVPGTFAFTTPATAPGAGTAPQSVTFTPTDTSDYNTVTTTVSVTVNKATPTITTSPTASAITYGQALSASTLTGGTASVPGTFAFTTPATAPGAGTAPQSVTFTPTDTTDYNTVTTTVSVTVNKATPTITTAPTASAITYGQALSASTLSGGVASVPGTFAFTTPATAPGAGTAPQSMTFTPTDTSDYNTVTTTVSVTVNKATPTITTSPTASAITYGQALSASTLTGGTASVPGTFAFTTPATAPGAGTAPQSVTFTPTDTTDYNTVTTTVSVTVNKATPTITTAPTASAITYGQALSASTLSGGVASVPGTFAFTTPATAPGAGTAPQSVTFTPTDTSDYNTVTTTVSVTVNKATPSITTAPTASVITYGQALSASALSGGVASVPGTFAFTTPATTPSAGTASQSVTFAPTDASDYNTVTTTVSVTVNKATPTITTAPTASAITLGQALSAAVLSGGVANTSGTFAFTTPSIIPSAGTASQSVTFTPTDLADYNTVTLNVSVTVNNKTTPTITTSPTASAITYGQALSASILSGGVASVTGTFAFTTSSTTPSAGTAPQSVTFTPTDTADYNSASTTVSVLVNPLAVILTGTRFYDGTTNAAATILSVSNIIGSDNVTVASGNGGLAGADIGTNEITSVGTLVLGGTAAGNYTLTGASGAVKVTPLEVLLTGTRPYDGTATALASILTINNNVDSTNLTLSGSATLAGAIAGLESITEFTGLTLGGTAATNYTITGASGSVTVTPATPTITTAPTASAITYGQALSASILSGGVASVAGTFAFTTPSTAPGAGTAPQSVTFTPTDTTDYNTVTTTVSVTVNKATPTITTAPTASAITYGQALSASTLSGGVASVAGTFAFTTPSTTPGAGTALQGVTFTPSDTADYNTVSITVSVTVNNKATPTITIAPTASAITYGQALSASVLSGGVASVAGTFAFTTPSTVPGAGTASQSVTFTPTDTTDYNTVTTTVSVTVNKATPSITTAPTASAITYGQALSASALSGGVGSVAGSFAFTTPSTMPGVGTASQGVTFTPIDATDYKAVSTTVSVLVNPLPVILTGTRTYDATTNAASTILSVSNIVGSDDVIVASGRGGLASAEMGTNAITSVRTLALGGTAAGNYTLIGASGAVEVTPLPVVLTGTRPYDGTATALASILTISNDLDGANLTLTGSATLAGASVALQDITDFTGLALGGTAATNYTLIGASGSVTITASEVTITCPQDITVNKATGECSQIVAFAPIATGNPAPTVVCVWNGNSITSPFSFPVGTNVVTCTASNLSGMESCNFKVTVVDTNPPVAGPNSLGTYENQTTSVAVAKMLLRDSAPSGGPLSIPSVVPTTANGASVSLGRGLITYVPPANFIGLDFITYTLSDGCGTAPGTINVLVLATNLPAKNEVSITHSASGTTVVFAGVPGASYVVQSAPAVTGPWTNLSNPLEAAANGLIQYTDTTSPPPATRFYRTQFVSGP